MDPDELLRQDIDSAIRAAKERGANTFYEVLAACEGADPKLVAQAYAGSPEHTVPLPAVARRETSELAALFPAADPVGCQWWYTLDTIERLASRVFEAAPAGSRVAFLGAPTVGYQYSRRAGAATVLEVDDHVLKVVESVVNLTGIKYDVADPIPSGHEGKYSVVLCDPPWYHEIIAAFLRRALELAASGGSVFCSLPPRLTRPGIIQERQDLLRTLLDHGIEIVSIERSAARYLVPEFERVAMTTVAAFDGRPWRAGDLLHVRRKANVSLPDVPLTSSRTVAFARSPKRFRVFMRDHFDAHGSLATWVTSEPQFQTTVSRRVFNPAVLHWWTSERRGGFLRNREFSRRALELWAAGARLDKARETLVEEGMSNDDARALCSDLDTEIGIWSHHDAGPVEKHTALAVHETQGRPYTKKEDDGFRGPFQRDRDRITWSRGLRQLANKTQVFPLATGDYLRNRLSHSLEVMQLATTIGASFDLNLSLIEAGALAHDIGHTPFGHAGEDALNSLFRQIKDKLGFNHYEHGVDVIRWLEDAYQSPAFGGVFGLNITPEVAECVFKHTYCYGGGGQYCQDTLYEQSKHRAYFSNDRCHLEGQAVRMADKVSYLISDLEDGIRVGALTLADLLSCELLRRPPLDLSLAPGESPHERFLSQRSLLIGMLMEDIIIATGKRLSRLSSLQDVRSADTYTVAHSERIGIEVAEIWNKLQAGKLHGDGRVKIANLRAARTVRELTLLFSVAPQLIDERFREGHARLHGTEYMNFYRHVTGTKVRLDFEMLDFLARDGGSALGFASGGAQEIPAEHLIQAKDFVAGLSDERARGLHHELLGF